MKKQTLKKFLVTTSLVAILTGNGETVNAAVVTNFVGFNAVLINGAGTSIRTPLGIPTSFFDNDSFYFSDADELSTGGNVTINGIDLNGLRAGPFIINHVTNLGSVVDLLAANTLAVNIAAGQLILSGNGGTGAANGVIAADTYTGLGAITLAAGTSLTINDGIDFDSPVDSAGGVGNGTITFLGDSVVSNTIGATETVPDIPDIISSVVLNGAGGTTVEFQNSINTLAMSLPNGAVAQIHNVATIGNLTFGNVNSQIQIEAGGIVALTPTANNLDINPDAATQFSFADDTSQLFLSAVEKDGPVTFTLQNNFDPGNANSGIITLDADGTTFANARVILTGNKTLGTPAHHIAQLVAGGNQLSTITELVNITNVNQLDINNAASLKVQTTTLATVPIINIGQDPAGPGELIFDAAAGNSLLLNGGQVINFEDPGSLLTLTNSSGASNRTVTLATPLAPGGGTDLKGHLEINANGTKNLTINGAAIGSDNITRLNILEISGNQTATINSQVFAKQIQITSSGNVVFGPGSVIDLGADGSLFILNNFPDQIFPIPRNGVTFSQNSSIKNIDARNKKATINVAANAQLKTDLFINGSNIELILGNNAQLLPYTIVNPNVLNINLNKITITNNAALAGFDYNVSELQAEGAGGNINFAAGANFRGAINPNGGAAANLVFAGNGRVRGNIGSGTAVGEIQVGANGVLELGGSIITAANIKANVAGTETLRFVNTALSAVISPIGNISPFNFIEFAGSDVDFGNSPIAANNFRFISLFNTTVATNNLDFVGVPVINNTGTNKNYTLVVGGRDITFDSPVGATGAKLGKVKLSSAHAININTANFHADLATGSNNQGSLNLNAANNNFGNIGTDGAAFNNVRFAANNTVADIYSTNINVDTGKRATFNGATKFANMKLTGTGSATFTNSFTGGEIDGDTGSNGEVNFASGALISENLGAQAKLAAVNFNANAGEAINLQKDINANIITFKNSKLEIGKHPLTLNGATTFTGTEINLGENDLQFTNGVVTFAGNIKIKTTVTDITKFSDAGNLVASSASNLTLGTNGNLEIDVATPGGSVDGQQITVIEVKNGVANIDLTKIKPKGGVFANWTAKKDGNKIVLVNDDQSETVIENLGGSESFAEAISNAVPGTQEFAIKAQLEKMTAEARVDAINRDQRNNSAPVSEITRSVIDSAQNIVTSRISSFTPTFTSMVPNPDQSLSINGVKIQTSSSDISGMAAGDDESRYGIWGSPVYGHSTQKTIGNSAGYRANSIGLTVGFDTKTNNDMILGAALSFIRNEVKFKDTKTGDKTQLEALLLSIYGVQQFTNHIFGQSVFTFGSTRVHNIETRRNSTTTTQESHGRYSSASFGAELMGGYNHIINDQYILTPMIGVDYKLINDNRYRETGTTVQNRTVTKKTLHKVDLIVGARLSSQPILINYMNVTPEIHAFVRHDVSNNRQGVKMEFDSKTFESVAAKQDKIQGNVGVSLNANYNMVESGISYDLYLAKKFIGQQGAIRLRVNF
jgi:outer membrane autotransporter protein